jgi:hypothetical protein
MTNKIEQLIAIVKEYPSYIIWNFQNSRIRGKKIIFGIIFKIVILYFKILILINKNIIIITKIHVHA